MISINDLIFRNLSMAIILTIGFFVVGEQTKIVINTKPSIFPSQKSSGFWDGQYYTFGVNKGHKYAMITLRKTDKNIKNETKRLE